MKTRNMNYLYEKTICNDKRTFIEQNSVNTNKALFA